MAEREHSEEYKKLEQAIAALEAKRATLGDKVVEAALDSMQKQLVSLKKAERKLLSTFKGERKMVTVMFADLSGFTALSETMDPEAVRELVNQCFDCLVPIVERYEGTVDKFIGDEIMALFGAPVAHENDPERALRTALDMMDMLSAFNTEHNTDLGMHIGINTGLVIAGGIGSEERQQYSVMGDTVNLAARLEAVSERGEIFVGPDTYRLTAPLFNFEPLAPFKVKGKTEPVVAYRLLTSKTVHGSVHGIMGLKSKFIGRDEELNQILTSVSALKEGQGSIISIISEAGLGKSRLVKEAHNASPVEVKWVEGRALSYTQDMSYWIARDILRGLLGVSVDAPLDKISDKLYSSIEEILPEPKRDEVWPYLAHILDLPLDEKVAGHIAQYSPQELRSRIQQAFSDYIRARSNQPLVLVWEDLHWSDISSLKLLETLLPLTTEVPLLLLFVFRQEEGPAWSFIQDAVKANTKNYKEIRLHPLSREHSESLLQSLLKLEKLPDKMRTQIVEKAEGNPLFLEEILRSLIDAGIVILVAGQTVVTDEIHKFKITDVPDTVQGVIAARIDRLSGDNKYTLQTAAIIGRIFQKQVLHYLLEKEQASIQLDSSLDELQRYEFIHQREVLKSENLFVDQEYIFKHILTQEMAYRSILIAHRKELHRIAGEAIETLFPERLDELSATLAYHFERAGIPEKAIPFLLQAGKRAVKLSAGEEAVKHFLKGLELIKTLPDNPERVGKELELQLPLAVTLMNLKGYGDTEVKQAFIRAQELCNQIGETPQIAIALYGLGTFYCTRAELKSAIDLAERILRISQKAPDPVLLLLIGHTGQTANFSLCGESEKSLIHAKKMIDLYDPKKHRSLTFIFGQDLKSSPMSYISFNLWLRGYPDQARKISHDIFVYNRELAHPATLIFAYYFACILYHFCQDVQALQKLAEESIALSTEYGFQMFIGNGKIFRGWCLVQQGKTEEGIAEMRQGIMTYQATGARIFYPYFLTMMAEAYRKAGQPEEGIAVLDEGLACVERTGERFYEAEIHRLKGELLMMQRADEVEVEEHYKQAIKVSQRQGAKSLELRAVMSLAHLWQKQGKQEQGRRKLEEIYNWFTEGFDTVDLKEAKTLLEELTHGKINQ